MQDSEDKWQGGKLVSWMLVRKLGLAVSSTSHGRGIRRLLLNWRTSWPQIQLEKLLGHM